METKMTAEVLEALKAELEKSYYVANNQTMTAIINEVIALRAELATLRGIKVGDTVIVTEAITEDDESRVGKTGKVTEILEGHSIFAYVVDFGSKAVRMDKGQIKRIEDAAPATEAPAVAEVTGDVIKVGDKVRVTSGTHAGMAGTALTVTRGKFSNCTVRPDDGGWSREIPLSNVAKL